MTKKTVDIGADAPDAEERALAQARAGRSEDDRPGVDDLVLNDLLVEDVSIDGMCGVY